jgi:hypothetical protein
LLQVLLDSPSKQKRCEYLDRKTQQSKRDQPISFTRKMSGTKAQRTNKERNMNMAREHSMRVFESRYEEPSAAYTSQPLATHTTVSDTDARNENMPRSEDLNFESSPLEIPTPTECIAHLKLLHVFAKLRHEVGNHEGFSGIRMEGDMEENSQYTAYDAAFAERVRDKRWSVYVTKAVARFEKWWDLLTGASTWYRSIRIDDFESAENDLYAGKSHITHSPDRADVPTVQRFPTSGDGYNDNSTFKLPPLDVLMVWHAYMLNPRIYLEDSVRYTKQTLWRTSFPWETIYESIDNETLDYRPEGAHHFEQSTGRPWDGLQDDRLAIVKCPQCSQENGVPWTQPPLIPGSEAMSVYLANDTGYAGSEFEHCCLSCSFIFTHEKLRVGKFCDDAHALLTSQRPLAGTILNDWGQPAGKTAHDPDFMLDMLR